MRRLVIDVRAALVDRPTGKGQWVRGFVDELIRRGQPITLLTDRPLPSRWKESWVDAWIGSPGVLWHLKASLWLLHRRNSVLFCAPTSFIISTLIGNWVPIIPVIHDLIAFRNEPHDRKAQWIERLTLRITLKRARHILTISQSTKNDLLARYSCIDAERISVIFAGPQSSIATPHIEATKDILCIGTLCPRKNQLRLIRAFNLLPVELRTHCRLILIGCRGWDDQAIIAAALNSSGVSWLDYLSDEDLENRMTTCLMVAFPSLYEGFGMPVLDAMRRGIPVLTSDRGSLPEVAGEAVVYADPESEVSLAAELKRLIEDEALRKRLALAGPLQASQFSWIRTVDLFDAAVKRHRED